MLRLGLLEEATAIASRVNINDNDLLMNKLGMQMVSRKQWFDMFRLRDRMRSDRHIDFLCRIVHYTN